MPARGRRAKPDPCPARPPRARADQCPARPPRSASFIRLSFTLVQDCVCSASTPAACSGSLPTDRITNIAPSRSECGAVAHRIGSGDMKQYLGQIVGAGLALTLAAASYGADAPSSSTTDTSSLSATSELPEIMVTAEKRSERLNDVPLSITALSDDQMSKQGIDDVADLQKVVPGFSYRLSQNGTPILQIRGIGFYDEQVAVSPTVTVYVDQVPLPYGRMIEGASLDLERVEVLKGPQGTLFGQNSTAGAINYIAAKPTSSFE